MRVRRMGLRVKMATEWATRTRTAVTILQNLEICKAADWTTMGLSKGPRPTGRNRQSVSKNQPTTIEVKILKHQTAPAGYRIHLSKRPMGWSRISTNSFRYSESQFHPQKMRESELS